MERVLSKCLVPTDQMIKNLVEIELGYINTGHPDFVGGTNMLMGMVNHNEELPRHDEESDRRSERSELQGKDKPLVSKSAGLKEYLFILLKDSFF